MHVVSSTIDRYVQEYGRPLSRLCLSLCRNPADAEDLYQDTWMKVIRYYERYETDKPFDKWLYALCINTYKNSRKAFWCRMQLSFHTNEDKDTFLACVAIPETDNDIYIDLLAALRRMPVKYKAVLSLKYFMGYGDDEIATILQIPSGTVKSRLHRAKEQLLKQINA